MGEQREHSRCLHWECPQHCCFLTHCMTLLETFLHFSATGCYDTNFLMCGVASSERRPCERGALRHSSCTNSPPPLSSGESSLCPRVMSWPRSPRSRAIHKVNIRRCFPSQGFSPGGFQKGPSAPLGAGVTSSQPLQLSAVPGVSRQSLLRLHFILAAVL